MGNLYFLHDAADGALVIVHVECDENDDIEEAITHEADKRGMGMSNVSWGGVSSISINA
jgi:hypothetical protein